MADSKQRGVIDCNGRVSKGEAYLSIEIVSEILSRLPIVSIIRCRSVCKEWFKLTQDPCFISLYMSRTENQPAGHILQPKFSDLNSLCFLDSGDYKARQIPIKIPSKKMQLNDLRIMCSCNGLLCIASESKLDPVFICNPIIRECVFLPPSRSKLHLLSHQVGLGFDPFIGRYKVVREYMNRRRLIRFEILTLGERSWRKLSAPDVIRDCEVWGAVSWNSAIHWKINRKVRARGRECVLVLDLKDEKFHILCFPDDVATGRHNFELLNLGGGLTLLEYDSHLLKMWKVTRDENGGFSICYDRTCDTFVRWNDVNKFAVISGSNHNCYMLQVSMWSDDRLNLKERLVQFFPDKALYQHLNIPGVPDSFEVFPFDPSLLSPKAALRFQ